MKPIVLSLLISIVHVAGQSYVSDVAPYQYLGCFSDAANPRTLFYSETTNIAFTPKTVESCVALCSSLSYIYAGLEYSYEVCRSATFGLDRLLTLL